MNSDYLHNIILNLPTCPGVYQYYNSEGKIIYVGKAKNLKRRVSSYFNKNQESAKTRMLVSKICDIKYIVVDSETDALLLENNLIKKYQPRYNILLKDGKTYPWLCITKEEYPRVFRTRQVFKGGEYFGPFSSVWVLDLLLELIKNIFPVRTCKLPLNKETIDSKKYSVCLEYHIKNCLGCCTGLQSKDDYQKMISQIREIAKGNSHLVVDYLKAEMQKKAEEYKFEEAQKIKEQIEAISLYQSKTIITTTSNNKLDIFGYDEDETSAYINILRTNNGAIVQAFTIEYHKSLDEQKEEILSLAILELRDRLKSDSTEIIVPFLPDLELSGVSFTIPQKGDKKKLLELSLQNVKQYKVDKYKQAEKLNPEQRQTKILKQLQDLLNIDFLPTHIECFDNSHISGSDAVAACVVYKMGKPSKKDYRTYIIKSVEGGDDYASMREVVYRRYSRAISESTALPNLIIADGGAGQISAITDSLKELNLDITVVGLAKNDKHKTRELIYNKQEIGLKPNDQVFVFLSQIQEEVHKAAIGFHKNRRSKKQTQSELDNIKGIGEKTKNILLSNLKSVKRIQNSEKSELEKLIGTARASVVYEYFHKI